ncbi:5'-nucleotidase C-terminal domain-containing protein [Rhodonellum sp.]|uniref:5'-nucleotidase C-terminal domain-containing protein n=1 Tax=Rhodonellum sp. TaxID=2231180 RepID=UPI0027263109|nr:5'-nucleotidase [Rhodonellum sp.]MDO9553120.1 5'-nucleotidase [Rhodonellum sp.]
MRIHPLFLQLFLILAVVSLSQCSPKLTKNHQSDFFAISAAVENHPQFDKIILPYKERLDLEMNTVIGQTVKELNKAGKGETTLGNFVADIQKEYAEETFGYPVDMSIINNGGMRNILPEGNITLRNVFELSPFDNYLYILELKADDVKKLAKFAAEKKILGINGMTIATENDLLTEFTVQGKPVEEGRNYLLAINDYLANGGDQMEFLIDLPRKEASAILLRDFILEKIKEKTAKGIKLDAEIEGRQKFK